MHRIFLLGHELYVLAARQPNVQRVADDWTSRRRAVLERHFNPGTSAMLDALIAGLCLDQAISHAPLPRQEVGEALRRMVSIEAPSDGSH